MPGRNLTPGTTSAAAPDLSIDVSEVTGVIEEYDPKSNLITVLQKLQAHYGYLPEPVVDELARLSGVPAARIYGIITFYAQFSTEPSGRHRIHVCHGTACHVAGATRITEALEQELGVGDGETTLDMEFTLGSVACMGACSQAPVMRIDSDTFGNLTADATRKVIRDILRDLGLERRDLKAKAAGGGAQEAGDV
jgi:NADH-quinone oxidoreductase subunit E